MYYNQNSIIDDINKKTGCSKQEVCSILDALSVVILDKASDTVDETEIKISTGIKILAKKQFAKDADTNLYNSGFMDKPKDKILIKARLTDNYKKKINELHRKKINR